MSGFTRSHTDMERINAIMSILRSSYPHARIALHYKNPWELLVSVILSAQCTDVMVNRVTELLFRKYPTLESYVTADLRNLKLTSIKQDFSGIKPNTFSKRP